MANPTVIQMAQQAPQFFDTLLAQQQQAFGGNQAALQSLSNAWAPVLKTGAVPFGYSKALDNLLQSRIIQTGAASTANAQAAEALKEKQEAGGANVLPTGASDQIRANIASQGAKSTAQNLVQEKQAGFEQGLKNLEGGTQAELGIAGAENSPQLAEAGTGLGELGLKAGQAQWEQNQVTSPLNLTSSILGDITSGAKAISGIGDVATMFSKPKLS